jgi:uncharacterized membrane protein YgcG
MSGRNYHVKYRCESAKHYGTHNFGRNPRSIYNSFAKVKLMMMLLMVVVILAALCLFLLIVAILHLFLLLRLSSLRTRMQHASMRLGVCFSGFGGGGGARRGPRRRGVGSWD